MAQYTVPVGKPANEHETAPRRQAAYKDAPIVRPIGSKANTVYEFLLESFERGGSRKSMAWRDIVELHEEKKMVKKFIDGQEKEVEKTWMYYELTDYKYNTFNELTSIMHDGGRGLVKMGLTPGGEDKILIFAATSHKWMKTFVAAQSQAIPVVTAYDTLGEKGLIHSLVQTGSKAIFTDTSLLAKLVNPVKSAKELKYVVHLDTIDPNDKRDKGKFYSQGKEAVEKLKEVRPDIQIYSFDDILSLGASAKDEIQPHHPKPDDLSCIMYTSGSTGDPKGVVLKHSNIVAGIAGVTSIVTREVVNENDRVIAFLPLAHIFELAFELITFYWGGILGYANVKTLTDASVRNCDGDMKTFKPTIMVGVAAVWETVRKGILTQVNKLPSFTQKIFWGSYHAKLKMKQYHLPGGDTLGNLVFKKVRQATGGCLRYVLNGGSPLSIDTQVFITNLLCPMLIGYGLTETVANTCVLSPSHFEFNVAGDLSGAITVKLVDVEELGYFAKNNQGEIWIKGAPVLSEYYKNEEETSKSLTADGWFQTGDIGEWTPKGHLKVIDRKKNLVKTLNGEYIALEKLESVYRSNPYVQNICVYADQSKVKPVGIVVPNEAPLAELAVSLGIIKNGQDVSSVHHEKKLKNAVLNELLKTGKSQGLGGIELLLGVVFVDEEWTPQNGFVTSAQKLQRKKILASVQKEVDELYASNQ